MHAETTVVATARANVAFTSSGGTPLAVTLRDHRALGSRNGPPATIQHATLPLLQYAVVTNGDTVAFSQVGFSVIKSQSASEQAVEFTATERNIRLAARYTIDSSDRDAYLVHAQVSVTGTSGKSFLLITMPRGFVSQEADPAEDATHLAYAFKPQKRTASSVAFSKLDPGERRIEEGPFTWVAAKSKYFLVALLADSVSTPFVELHVIGAPRTGKLVTQGEATVIADPSRGPVTFDIYAGPQEWTRLRAHWFVWRPRNGGTSDRRPLAYQVSIIQSPKPTPEPSMHRHTVRLITLAAVAAAVTTSGCRGWCGC